MASIKVEIGFTCSEAFAKSFLEGSFNDRITRLAAALYDECDGTGKYNTWLGEPKVSMNDENRATSPKGGVSS